MKSDFHVFSGSCNFGCRQKIMLEAQKILETLGEQLATWHPPLGGLPGYLPMTLAEFYAHSILKGICQFHQDAACYLNCVESPNSPA